MIHNNNTSLYFRFNRFLERNFPQGLYRRALLIMIVPLIVLQLIMAGLMLDRYWDAVTKAMGRSLSAEIGLITELYLKSDKSDQAVIDLQDMIKKRLRHSLVVEKKQGVPSSEPAPYFRLFEHKMQQYLQRETGKPFWINTNAPDDKIEIQIEVEPGVVFHIFTEADRARATATPWLLTLMLLSSVLISTIATMFLRNQIKPVIELARAAQAFGMGRDMGDFKPRGAREVKLAGSSFVEMKRRIARHVEQRTAMLAGVSHDLRTILTRFRLELAMLGNNPKAQPLREDVDEMQRMLEDYMNFVRGDGGEPSEETRVIDVIQNVVANSNRDKKTVSVADVPDLQLPLKPNAFKRLLLNVIGNAARYGTNVQVSGEIRDERLWIYVDDNGPGIPIENREDAFRPFVRLDESRNMDETGTGLGLAIALDVAHAHGGDIELLDSPLGGLRVAVKIPI